jgi:hypothetical protein
MSLVSLLLVMLLFLVFVGRQRRLLLRVRRGGLLVWVEKERTEKRRTHACWEGGSRLWPTLRCQISDLILETLFSPPFLVPSHAPVRFVSSIPVDSNVLFLDSLRFYNMVRNMGIGIYSLRVNI